MYQAAAVAYEYGFNGGRANGSPQPSLESLKFCKINYSKNDIIEHYFSSVSDETARSLLRISIKNIYDGGCEVVRVRSVGE